MQNNNMQDIATHGETERAGRSNDQWQRRNAHHSRSCVMIDRLRRWWLLYFTDWLDCKYEVILKLNPKLPHTPYYAFKANQGPSTAAHGDISSRGRARCDPTRTWVLADRTSDDIDASSACPRPTHSRASRLHRCGVRARRHAQQHVPPTPRWHHKLRPANRVRTTVHRLRRRRHHRPTLPVRFHVETSHYGTTSTPLL